MSKPNIYLAFMAGLFYLIYDYDTQMKLFFAWRFSERRKRIHFLKDLQKYMLLKASTLLALVFMSWFLYFTC